MHIEQSNSTFIHFKFNFCENNAHLCIYFQLHTFLHLFFSQAGKQYHLWFNICLFQSTSVSTVQTAGYPGSDNSMCKLTLINRGHIFWDFTTVYPYMISKIGCLSGWKFVLVTLAGFLSTIYLHMLFQIRCFKCWKIALIIFVGLYSNVYHYMNSQIGCLSGCKFALVTFVGFSSTMYLHVIVQICCERYQKIALITFIGLFSTVCPQANPIAKYHCHMYLLTSTRADYSLNEFPPQKIS